MCVCVCVCVRVCVNILICLHVYTHKRTQTYEHTQKDICTYKDHLQRADNCPCLTRTINPSGTFLDTNPGIKKDHILHIKIKI